MPSDPRRPVYLDNHATTALDPSALKAMLPYLRERYGNPSSRSHRSGQMAAQAMEEARAQVSKLIGSDPSEVFFTSGATEANNIAIKGLARASKRRHLVTLDIEHRSVLDPLRRLEAEGYVVTRISPGRSGVVDPRAIGAALRPDTLLVCVMAANNEIGTVQPVEAIAELAHRRGALVLCDAVQAAGKLDLRRVTAGADLITLSAHKLHGPKGVGMLGVRGGRSKIKLIPLFDGGAQEGGLRSGTPNVPGIVGFGEAARLASLRLTGDRARLLWLRKRLWSRLRDQLPAIHLNGDPERRLPNNLNITIDGVKAAELLKRAVEVEFSGGSACLTSSPEPSYVLRSIGLTEEQRWSSIRLGLARTLTASDIDRAAAALIRAVRDCRRTV
ncbi:MAG: Cysteine desulfurase IscS [Candidatus Omnitrophica bacterium]|nr:Cysteine desulfurase IscS [Candidatus Omnitrophota bacterium]